MTRRMRELESLAYELGSAATEELLDAGRRARRRSRSRRSCICAMPAPIPRCPCRCRSRGIHARATSRRCIGSASASCRRRRASIVAAARGRGARRRRYCAADARPPARGGVARRGAGAAAYPDPSPLRKREGEWRTRTGTRFIRAVRGTTRRSDARGAAPGRRSPGRRSSSSRIRPSSSSPAGGWTSRARNDLVLDARRCRASARRSADGRSRCCWKCSTTCSWRSPSRWARRCATPRSRSTSRSGSTSPAPCSTPTGALVANAPHMPVHLGSHGPLGRDDHPRARAELRPGDVYMLNAPYNGGTHLPDITVITPVFDERRRRGAVLRGEPRPPRGRRRPDARLDDAARHHHRGGRRLYRQRQAGRRGPLPRGARRARCCTGAKYPARQPDKNIADLKAQVAANAKGDEPSSQRMVAHFGLDVVSAYMRPRAGQRRGERAPAAVAARRRRTSASRRIRARRSRCASPSTAASARRRSTSPARARSSRTTSTRRSR